MTKVEFSLCKSCWKDPSKYGLVFLGQSVSVDSTSARYWDHIFAVSYLDEISGAPRFARISQEAQLLAAINKVRPQLQQTIGSELAQFLSNKAAYSGQMPQSRRSLAHSVRLQLTQSVLSEDVQSIGEAIRSAIQPYGPLRDLRNVSVEYWGQSEFVKDTKGTMIRFLAWT